MIHSLGLRLRDSVVKTVEKTDAVFLRVLSTFFSGEWFKSYGRKFNYGLGHL